MKKTLFAVLSILLFASSAFAVATDTSSEELVIGGGADNNGAATAELLIGLSPKVVGHYLTDGTTESTAQWYAIATVHPGGNIAYATAQDLNNVYMIWYVTGTDPVTSVENVPQTRNPDPPAEGETATDWIGMGWSLTPPTGPAS
ncbi:MAG: hypothetical protein AB7F21_03795 [Desulfuromonadales bacterium]